MPLEIKSHISIHTCDGKKVWNVPEECIVLSHGTQFIRLPRKHHGFACLVMHGCNSLPDNRKRNFIGYSKLLDLRTKAQESLDDEKAEKRAALCKTLELA